MSMTLKDLLDASVAAYGSSIAFRSKAGGRWQDMTYAGLRDRVWRVSELLAHHRIRPGHHVAILRDNAPDWAESYFGIVGLGAVAVPLDPKLTEREALHVLRDSGARAIIASVKSYALLRNLEDRLPELRLAILVDGRELLPVEESRVAYLDYEQGLAEVAGSAASAQRVYERSSPDPDDTASLIYTSGTTGQQKGAMLSHRNLAANVHSCSQVAVINNRDSFLLVLPLFHAFAFTANLLLPLYCGAQICFVESLRTVGENVAEIRPTVLIGVPLLLEKMHNRLITALHANRLGHLLYRLGMKAPIRERIRGRLGGRLRLIVTGGAACPVPVLQGFSELGIPVAEGYGLTEASPVLTLNPVERPKPGTVGRPLPGVEIRIVDPDETGVGEIAAKGPNIMKGYHLAEAETAQVLKDGWLMTGDLGCFDDEGYLQITGRKKSLIVNREGKNIHPEEVEQVIGRSPFIAEVLVLPYEDARDAGGERVGIIVVPNLDAIDDLAAREDRRYSEEDVKELLQQEVRRLSRDLAEYKRPRRVNIRTEEFLKTSTGKIKRYLYRMEEIGVE